MLRAQFELDAVLQNQARLAALIEDRLHWKQVTLHNLIGVQSLLFGEYLSCYRVTETGDRRAHPTLLFNAIGNCITGGLSGAELLRQGYYGSCRVVIRQLVEMLLTAKLSLLEPAVLAKWEARTEESGREVEVSVTSDILRRYWGRHDAQKSPLGKL